MKWSDVYSPDALSRVNFEEKAAARRYGGTFQRPAENAEAALNPRLDASQAIASGAAGIKRALLAIAVAIAAAALIAFVIVPALGHETASVPLQSAQAASETDSNAVEEALDGPLPYETQSDYAPSGTSSEGFHPMASPVYGTELTGNDWSGVTSADFEDKTIDEKVALIGAMAHDDEVLTGVPAELTAAQAILESGWMNSGLSREHENYFGIKASSEGYNWDGSTWDGSADGSVAVMATQEEYEEGVITDIEDGFRVYDGLWDSIRDHSAYLLNSGLYDGIEDAEDIEDVLDMVVGGGYATSSSYKEMLLEIIGTYGLERFSAR